MSAAQGPGHNDQKINLESGDVSAHSVRKLDFQTTPYATAEHVAQLVSEKLPYWKQNTKMPPITFTATHITKLSTVHKAVNSLI